jgi:hypothetical protein
MVDVTNNVSIVAERQIPLSSTGRVPKSLELLVARLNGLLADAEDVDAPAEFEPVAALPLDECVLGVVRHAGQANADPPLAVFDPARCSGVYLGADTRRGVGVLLGVLLADASGKDRSLLEAVADESGFDPALLPAEMPLDVLPRVPPGWRLARTADGLGVLAPAGWFSPGQSFDDDADESSAADVPTVLAAAHSARSDGHTATALWLVRNAAVFAAPAARPALAAVAAACRDELARPARFPDPA